MMAHETKTVEIDNEPTLLQFFNEVRESGEALVVTHGGKELVVVLPPEQFARGEGRTHVREKTEADLQAFRAAAGGWRGKVDIEAFKRNNAESRRISSRPVVKLE